MPRLPTSTPSSNAPQNEARSRGDQPLLPGGAAVQELAEPVVVHVPDRELELRGRGQLGLGERADLERHRRRGDRGRRHHLRELDPEPRADELVERARITVDPVPAQRDVPDRRIAGRARRANRRVQYATSPTCGAAGSTSRLP